MALVTEQRATLNGFRPLQMIGADGKGPQIGSCEQGPGHVQLWPPHTWRMHVSRTQLFLLREIV